MISRTSPPARHSLFSLSLVLAVLCVLSLVFAGCASSAATGQKPSPVPAPKDCICYLLSYSKIDPQTLQYNHICFAVSTDGFCFYPLNSNKPVLDSAGFRNPFIMRTEDGEFYMVAEDISVRRTILSRLLGRANEMAVVLTHPYVYNRGFVLMKSLDLVNWSTKVIRYSEHYPEMEEKLHASEPLTVYDPAEKKYLILFKTEWDYDIYGAYANADFTGLESTPQLMPDRKDAGTTDEHNYRYLMYNDFSSSPEMVASIYDNVLPIARSELNALLEKWGRPDGFELPERNNPVIEAFYADPGTLYSEKTGKYYIYPTHDGFPGWGGKDFQVFSSSDLKEWKFERTILTLGEDVEWSSGNAWAPCIMERKQPDGTYKYYFYFCGALKGDGRKCIGCAVADDPLGPFTDIGRPVIDFKPEGVRGGQEIDPDVFHDPVGGKYYLYWGNGYMAGAELNDDMLGVKRDTVKVFRPGRTFREGTNVICRNGRYYFSWSVDDTGSPNYHVRYATADAPLGDLTVPPDNVVIEKAPSHGILGTGHHQILKVHGTDDEWRIVYHRFAWQNGKVMDGPGFHREVCIDKLEFNEDGSIRKVIPTL